MPNINGSAKRKIRTRIGRRTAETDPSSSSQLPPPAVSSKKPILPDTKPATANKTPTPLDTKLVEAPPREKLPLPKKPSKPAGPVQNVMDHTQERPEKQTWGRYLSDPQRSVIQESFSLLNEVGRIQISRHVKDKTREWHGASSVKRYVSGLLELVPIVRLLLSSQEKEQKRTLLKKDRNGNFIFNVHGGKTTFPDDALEEAMHVMAKALGQELEKSLFLMVDKQPGMPQAHIADRTISRLLKESDSLKKYRVEHRERHKMDESVPISHNGDEQS